MLDAFFPPRASIFSWMLQSFLSWLLYCIFFIIIIIIIIIINYFFYSLVVAPYWSSLPLFIIPILLLPVSKMCPLQPPARPPHSLGHQVSQGLGSSSPTEARAGSPLLCICQGPQTSLCMLPGWWLSVWKISGIWVSWDCWSPYGVTLLYCIVLEGSSPLKNIPLSVLHTWS
jgi:energy-coupling factor transporter transmembrane protein EcfT